MKTAAFGISGLGITVFVFMALLQIVNVDTREVSLRDNLQSAMKASLSTALDARAYTVNDEEELVADVVQGIVLELNDPRAELDIQINAVDRTMGLLSMKVTAHYPSVTTGAAREGTSVSVERTVILEHVDTEAVAGSHTVVFTNPGGAVVKSYTLTSESQKLPYPSYTPSAGKSFAGWSLNGTRYANNAAGRQSLQNLSLDRDYTFVAVEQ